MLAVNMSGFAPNKLVAMKCKKDRTVNEKAIRWGWLKISIC